MNIEIIQELHCANGVTHAGLFHADEVMATVILSYLHDISLCRVFHVPEGLSEDVIVYDIGMGRYDHHQKGGNGCRPNGINYAACGLIWRDFGHEVIKKAAPDLSGPDRGAVWKRMDDVLISRIDAADNGVISQDEPTAFTALISACNPTWDDETESDEAFAEAVSMAEIVFSHKLSNAISNVRANTMVRHALDASEPPILFLDRFMPWRGTLFAFEKERKIRFQYVIFPANRGGYNCQCVPEESNLFCPRCPFPESWRGLKDDALQKVSEVADAVFCHPAGFLASAETKAGALSLAKAAMETANEKRRL